MYFIMVVAQFAENALAVLIVYQPALGGRAEEKSQAEFVYNNRIMSQYPSGLLSLMGICIQQRGRYEHKQNYFVR